MGAELIWQLETAAEAAGAYADAAKAAVRPLVSKAGKIDRVAIDREQHVVHGLAWVATYAETLREVRDWARALDDAGKFSETEQLLAKLLVAEYGAQLAGGLPMTQVETIRPADFGIDAPPVTMRITQAEKTRLAALLHESQGRATFENTNLDADRARLASAMTNSSRSRSSKRWANWACSASPSRRSSAARGSARPRCASSPKSCRAPISASARSAPAPRSRPS
jgi:hypothetical protein